MQTKHSAMIAALLLTAIVLSAILLTTGSQRAEATMIDAQPDVTLLTAPVGGGPEPLVVIDKIQGKMLVYELNGADFKVTGTFKMGAK